MLFYLKFLWGLITKLLPTFFSIWVKDSNMFSYLQAREVGLKVCYFINYCYEVMPKNTFSIQRAFSILRSHKLWTPIFDLGIEMCIKGSSHIWVQHPSYSYLSSWGFEICKGLLFHVCMYVCPITFGIMVESWGPHVNHEVNHYFDSNYAFSIYLINWTLKVANVWNCAQRLQGFFLCIWKHLTHTKDVFINWRDLPPFAYKPNPLPFK